MTEVKLLGRHDEPQESGAVVAVHYGDYRRQEIWVRSGANTSNWYPLGGEFGRPQVWIDTRNELEKLTHLRRGIRVGPGPNEVPLHPQWSDVLARGPVTLLTPGNREMYIQGWRAGRRDLCRAMEAVADDDPQEVEV